MTMMTKMTGAAVLAAAATIGGTAPAATFNVTYSNPQTVPLNNEYRDALAGLGYNRVAVAPSIVVSGPARVTYEFLGSESGLTDQFKDGLLALFAETNGGVGVWDPVQVRALSPQTIGTVTYTGAAQLGATFLSGEGFEVGTSSLHFGLYVPSSGTGTFSSDTVYFGLDDRRGDPTADSDYDDFIVRATISAVPEPGAWLLMIVGFGMVGAAARSRTRAFALA